MENRRAREKEVRDLRSDRWTTREGRINAIVALAQRRMQYLAQRDKEGLIRLAGEYAEHRMPKTAREIMAEAECL